jgi:hypothetical protein
LLSTFGPGSIVDLRDAGSYVVLGLAGWRQGERIEEPNLQALLGVDRLSVPGSTEDGDDIAVSAFPRWHHCANCQRLLTEDFCRRRECERAAPPARFIIACRNGHLDDFPWVWWVHRGDSACSGTTLELDDNAGSNSLGDLWVRCKEHALSRSLQQAMAPDAFESLNCPRTRPWLGDTDAHACDKRVVGVLRGASNVWFPDSLSALSLPRHSSPVSVHLKDHFATLLAVSEKVRRAMLDDLLAATKFTVDEGLMAFEQHFAVVQSAHDLRREEYDALTAAHGAPDLRPPAPYFEAREGASNQDLETIFDRVVLVDRLREVSALRGFTRLEGPDPENPDLVRGAPITTGKPSWLPAREVFGEGIFLSVAEGVLRAWEDRPEVALRARLIQLAYDGWRAIRDLKPAPGAVTPRKVALHTLAHLLIRELSLVCGYGVSSLRERIYADHGERGLLVYTASADSDGSLGGLVAMGEPSRLGPVINSLVNGAGWCSQDPLCAEREPDPGGHVSGAACHACLLLPETSCELGNRLLDRVMLVDASHGIGLIGAH